MFEASPVKNIAQVRAIFSTMDKVFGGQEHLAEELLLKISLDFPGFVNVIENEQGEHLAHVCFIPLNEQGYRKMVSPEFDESEVMADDIFRLEFDAKMYLFVYSIFSTDSFLTKSLIRATVETSKRFIRSVSQDSLLFAEVVSTKGDELARKMSFQKYHTYEFKGEELHLYQTGMSDFVQAFRV